MATEKQGSTAPSSSRRELLRGMGALGIGAPLGVAACSGTTSGVTAAPRAPQPAERVPSRPFGRTGAQVSSLALGGYFDALANQALLARALELGVTYWETTLRFGGKGYGEYFRQHPGARERVFLMAKTRSALTQLERSAALAQMEADLSVALTETGTDRIDFFLLGQLRETSLFNDDVRRWVERAKAAGKVRFFGFSSHANMQDCLLHASTLDWIDGAMVAYNYRLMQVPSMQQAVDACARRGIALTAVKSQGLDTNPEATIGEDTPAARKLLEKLLGGGQSEYQARLQAVWSNPAISSICSMMTTPEALLANASASWQTASWQTPSSSPLAAYQRPRGHRSSEGKYRTGCASVCEGSLAEAAPVADVMRQLMYARSYGDRARARAEFAALGPAALEALGRQDYSLAEQRCPQRLPIARWMADARRELG